MYYDLNERGITSMIWCYQQQRSAFKVRIAGKLLNIEPYVENVSVSNHVVFTFHQKFALFPAGML